MEVISGKIVRCPFCHFPLELSPVALGRYENRDFTLGIKHAFWETGAHYAHLETPYPSPVPPGAGGPWQEGPPRGGRFFQI